MERYTSPLNLPTEAWRFDEDEALIERAQVDIRLADYLDGLRKARAFLAQNPESETFKTLVEQTELATGEYVIGRLGWRPPDTGEQGRP